MTRGLLEDRSAGAMITWRFRGVRVLQVGERKTRPTAYAILAAVGYNFHILLRWLSLLLRKILAAKLAMFGLQPA